MRILAPLVAPFVALINAAVPKIPRGLASAELKNDGQKLDVYTLAEKVNLAVVVWVHVSWQAVHEAIVQKKTEHIQQRKCRDPSIQRD